MENQPQRGPFTSFQNYPQYPPQSQYFQNPGGYYQPFSNPGSQGGTMTGYQNRLRDVEEDSLQESMQSIRRPGEREEPINLVSDSIPNFARIDHFGSDANQQDKPQERDQEVKVRDEGIQMQKQQEETRTVFQEQKVPEFYEELKNMREELSHEYQEKLRRDIQELEEYKKQMNETQVKDEQRKFGQFQREVQERENQLQMLSEQRLQVEEQLRQAERTHLEKEQVVVNQRHFIETQRAEIEKLRDIISEQSQKEEVLKSYTESLKREALELRSTSASKVALLESLQNQDWSKLIIDLKNENQILKEELLLRSKELKELKSNLSTAVQNGGSSVNQVLENQSAQLVRMRRLVEEYERREKQCARKWTALIQENQGLQEKTAGLRQQLARQKEFFQNVIAQNERKILECNQRLALTQHTDEKRAAAEFLVDQMRQQSEEKQALIQENEQLHLHLQDLQDQIRKLSSRFPIDHSIPQEHAVSRLLSRIEELEDLLVEVKSQQAAAEVAQLKQILVEKDLELTQLSTKFGEMCKQRTTVTSLFEGNELYTEFQKIIRERDRAIGELKKELSAIKNKEFMDKMSTRHQIEYQNTNKHEALKNLNLQTTILAQNQGYSDLRKDAESLKSLGMQNLHINQGKDQWLSEQFS